jgi:Holliday junction resolvase RusA-like endonuclease
MTRSGRAYTPKETKEYESNIANAYSGVLFAEGPLHVTLIFDNDKTEITIRSMRKKSNPSKLRGDIDNYAKSVLDGIDGVAYTYDKQIVSLELRKK